MMIDQRIHLLDKGWIELQNVMGDDMTIVNAARVSQLGESKGAEADKKLLFYLMRHHHTSPFEMVEFRFRACAPLMVFWQWVRHRTWHVNAQSGRYTEFNENDFYTPGDDSWRKQSASNKQGSDGFLNQQDGFELTEAAITHFSQGYALYKDALSRGVAKEQARIFLPGFATYYTWVLKVDAHNLMNFLRLRAAPDAQHEIRVYADAIYHNFFKPTLPWTAEAFEEQNPGLVK